MLLVLIEGQEPRPLEVYQCHNEEDVVVVSIGDHNGGTVVVVDSDAGLAK